MAPELTAINVTEQLGEDLATKDRLVFKLVNAKRSLASTPKRSVELVGLAIGCGAAGGIVYRLRFTGWCISIAPLVVVGAVLVVGGSVEDVKKGETVRVGRGELGY